MDSQILTIFVSKGNGYIEGKELDSFLRELGSNAHESGAEVILNKKLNLINRVFLVTLQIFHEKRKIQF